MKLNPEDASKYLQYLSIGHYILGAFIALIGCFPIIHLVMGIAFTVASLSSPQPGAEVFGVVGPVFALFALGIIGLIWTVAGLVIATGRFLSQRKNHLFCLVVCFVEAFFAPVGTVLGVLTIIILIDDATKSTFDVGSTPAPALSP